MTCAHCGQPFEGGRCPNCGHPVASSSSRAVAVLIAVFLVLPLALVGACGVLTGVAMVAEPDGRQGGFWAFLLFIGAVATAACVGLAFLVRNLWRS